MPRMTSAEYVLYQSKRASLNGKVPQMRDSEALIGAAERERDLHLAILQECRNRTWIALHGSMAHSTYRTPGEWDFTILADHGRVFFIEAKTGDGKLSNAQQAIHHWAEYLGHRVWVVRNIQQFMEVVR